jgi:uncharacterized delta-60 repeat protein
MRPITLSCLLCTLFAGVVHADGPDGSIDATYGSVFGRSVVSEFPAAPEPGPYMGAMAVSVAGRSWLFGEYNILEATTSLPMARLDTLTGALDPAFGGGTGLRSSPYPIVGGTWFRDLNAVVQPDGKPLIAGRVRGPGNDRGFVCRLNVAGNFDATFGTGGCVTLRAFAFANERCGIEAIALGSASGGITVAGHCDEVDSAARQAFTARYTASGQLDTEYGAGVGVTLPQTPGSALQYLRALQVLDDGRIMAAGSALRDDQFDIALLRLSSDGTPDPEYGNGGHLLLAVDLAGGLDDLGTGLAVRPDGRVLVMGTAEGSDQDGEVVLWQTSADGVADATFGTAGLAFGAEPLKQAFEPASQLVAYLARMRLSIDDIGRAVVMGRTGAASEQNDDVRVYRFTQNGRRDRDFGDVGRGVVDVDNDVSLPGPGASEDIPTFILAQRTRILIGTISVRDSKRFMVTLALTGVHLFRGGFEDEQD